LFRDWDLYARIVHHNWMRHREVSDCVAERLAPLDRPLRVLDLGCGDGQLSRRGLRSSWLAAYTGVDLSAGALETLRQAPPSGRSSQTTMPVASAVATPTATAAANLTETPTAIPKAVLTPFTAMPVVETRQADLRDAAATMPAAEHDVVLANYSLHHLSTDEKRETLAHIRRGLRSDGVFIWSDIYRRPGESRLAYLESLERRIRREWTLLSVAEIDQVVAHIFDADFPEEEDWMRAAAADAGFTHADRHFQDESFVVWSFHSP
jgi:SAM-dependent methyltransferase